MKTRIAMLLLVVTAAFAAESRDPAAVALARRTLEAMGGEQAFANLRTLKFDFVVERDGKEVGRIHHVWDRWDGRYRVEGLNREGKRYLTLFNVQKAGTGRSWLDGKELEGDALKTALERAYGRFINDTYWLLMPAKMQDPGVNLASEGEAEKDGKAYDVVRLTFGEGVGLTPKDTYWAYISKESGLMERWEFVLTGQEAKDREAFAWTDWQAVGGVRLAMAKAAVGEGSVIRFDHVSGSEAADDSAFVPPQ
jgi:uncharacterized protein DUF6503